MCLKMTSHSTNNPIAVVDVGSNSVRLLLSCNGVTVFKGVKVTKLAEGVLSTSTLNCEAIDRTVDAVREFCEYAHNKNAEKIFIFATAGVRQAKNGKVFTDKVKEITGISVDVISGETEAKIGALGALLGTDGGLVDVGGASTEITVIKDGETVYSKSINVGAVRLCESYSGDVSKLEKQLDNLISEFSVIPKTEFTAIGGSVTSIVSILLKLCPYDPSKVDGYQLKKTDVYSVLTMLFSMSIEERENLVGLQPERAEIIPFGTLILYKIMQYLGINYITVSEKDNLEGYLKYITEKI